MNELGCRVWDKTYSVMRYVSTIDFYPKKLGGGIATIQSSSRVMDRGTFILMLSIGLPDKSGKKIFKGDIITGNLFDKRVPIMGAVVYDSKHACYGLENQAGITPLFRIAEIKIIGNVHENPEEKPNNASQS